MKAGERLLEISSLDSGTARDLILNIECSGTGEGEPYFVPMNEIECELITQTLTGDLVITTYSADLVTQELNATITTTDLDSDLDTNILTGDLKCQQ